MGIFKKNVVVILVLKTIWPVQHKGEKERAAVVELARSMQEQRGAGEECGAGRNNLRTRRLATVHYNDMEFCSGGASGVLVYGFDRTSGKDLYTGAGGGAVAGWAVGWGSCEINDLYVSEDYTDVGFQMNIVSAFLAVYINVNLFDGGNWGGTCHGGGIGNVSFTVGVVTLYKY